jgi:hypothetical protein
MILESPGISRVHIALAIVLTIRFGLLVIIHHNWDTAASRHLQQRQRGQGLNIKTFCIAQRNTFGVFCEQPQPYP